MGTVVALLALIFALSLNKRFKDQQKRIDELERLTEDLSTRLQKLTIKRAASAPPAQKEDTKVHLPVAPETIETDPVALYVATLQTPEAPPEERDEIAAHDAAKEPPAEPEHLENTDADVVTVGPWSKPGSAEPVPELAEEPPMRPARPKRTSGASFEQRLSTNWLVWIGGVALALAGVFLVRYIAEQGWLSPATRCALGVMFGVALTGAGEVVRRRPLERAIAALRPNYVPQALTSAGLVTAFGSVYLAYAFYELIPSRWSIVALGGIAIAAFALSMAQGPFVALLGLVGAALTPALVSTDDPNAWGFFSYLGVIAVASIAVADRKKWYWLPELAILAIAGWGILWLRVIFSFDDVLPIGLTAGVVGLAALGLALRAKPAAPSSARLYILRVTNASMVAWSGLALAGATAFTLALLTNFVPEAHWLVFAFTLVAAVIARRVPAFGAALPVMSVLAVIAFALTYIDIIAIENLAEKALGWPAPTLYFIENYRAYCLHGALLGIMAYLGGLATVWQGKRSEPIAVITGGVPLALAIIGYAQFRNYSGDLVWVGAATGVLVAATATTAFLIVKDRGTLGHRNIYAALAVLSAFAAATFLWDRIWLTLAYGGIVLAVSAIATRADLIALRRSVNLIVLVVLMRLTINPDLRGYEIFHPFGLQWVTYGYLVPLAFFLGARHLFKRVRDDITVTVLEGAALLLGIMFVSIEIRIIMTGAIYSGAYELPEMSLQTIAWLTSALILAHRNLKYPRLFSKWGARLLTVAGTVQAVAFQLVLENPVFTGEFIEGFGLFNVLILSLLAPAVLLWLIARVLLGREDKLDRARRIPITALRALSTALAFAFVTEEVRVFFQGMLITPAHLSLLELYATTTIWLLIATIPYVMSAARAPRGMRTTALGVVAVAAFAVVVLHALLLSPTLTGEPVRGWPVFNVLILGFLVPASLFYFVATRLEGFKQKLLAGVSYFTIFIGLSLIVKHAFQGHRLAPMHENLLELYLTTLVWILLGALPFVSRRVGAMIGAHVAGYAVLALSLFMLFGGHAVSFNPLVDGSFVRGPMIFNEFFVGFIVPSALLALLSLKMTRPAKQILQIAAYLLLFIGVTMLVKHAFQGPLMHVRALSTVENYAYSTAWLTLAILTMIAGIAGQRREARHAALAILLIVVLKVFLLDMSNLSGLWRIASFFGLGISLIAIGWVYQHFVFARPAMHDGMVPDENE